MRPSRVLPVLMMGLEALGGRSEGLAQTVSGWVVDAASHRPLSLALVIVEDDGVELARAVTDRAGAFEFVLDGSRARMVALRARRIGYRAGRATIWLGDEPASVQIALTPLAVELDTINVVAPGGSRRLRLSGFYDRAASGFGHFITEEDISARRPLLTSDLLRRVPGMRVVPLGSGRLAIYVTRPQGRFVGGECPPMIVVDDMVVSTPSAPSITPFDELVRPDEIAGIEVYRGPAETPARYGGAQSACGVIVIWTK